MMDIRTFFKPPPNKRAKLPLTLETESRKSGSGSSSADDSDNEITGTLMGTTMPEETSSSSCTKQAPTFRRGWLKGRENWLKFVDGMGMFCELCIKHDKRSFNRQTWNTVPCTRFRLQSITMHERCTAHRDSISLELAAAATPTIMQAINLPEVPARGMEQAFSCLYFLAKQRITHTTNFEPLLDIMQLIGVPIKSDLHVAKNGTYTSNKSIQEMLYCISEVIESKILNELRESEHFSHVR